MVLVKMLMEIVSPTKEEVGDDDGFYFPLREGSFPGRIALPESKRALARFSPRDGGASSRKYSLGFF